ncbi:MAG: hypothetical protein KDD44_08475, partial [Bdellovibrionales bacterium]|nr:hypothetical protein [Bdellovibrionales bacterium]
VSGIEGKVARNDFFEIVRILQGEPPSRVSFESADNNNAVLGSVRAWELLPAITAHTIVEGGIVNSAWLPGIPYFLQCLSSSTCAGWPRGSIMPRKDLMDAVHYMDALGVNYHITATEENRQLLERTGLMEPLFRGRYLSLYRRRSVSSMVEAFESPPVVAVSSDPRLTILGLPRMPELQQAALGFAPAAAAADADDYVRPSTLINTLTERWYGERHLDARYWEDRTEPARGMVVTYLLLRPELADSVMQNRDFLLSELPPLIIADRSFDPNLHMARATWEQFDVVVPLVAPKPGPQIIRLNVSGYRAEAGGRELVTGLDNEVEFFPVERAGAEVGFAVLRFRPLPGVEWGRWIDLVHSASGAVRSGLPGPVELTFPQRSTSQCNPTISAEFQRLTLRTECPGKPHLVKFSYAPNWSADVPIYPSVNGYMLLTPTHRETILEHRARAVDWVGYAFTAFGFVMLTLGLRGRGLGALA